MGVTIKIRMHKIMLFNILMLLVSLSEKSIICSFNTFQKSVSDLLQHAIPLLWSAPVLLAIGPFHLLLWLNPSKIQYLLKFR